MTDPNKLARARPVDQWNFSMKTLIITLVIIMIVPAGMTCLGAISGTGQTLTLATETPIYISFKAATFDTVVSGFVFCSVRDPTSGLAEVRRVLSPAGALRMLEHVRSTSRFWASVQDLVQPAWTAVTGGCHPNRETERAVEIAGFAIEAEGRRAEENTRSFQARPTAGDPGQAAGPISSGRSRPAL